MTSSEYIVCSFCLSLRRIFPSMKHSQVHVAMIEYRIFKNNISGTNNSYLCCACSEVKNRCKFRMQIFWTTQIVLISKWYGACMRRKTDFNPFPKRITYNNSKSGNPERLHAQSRTKNTFLMGLIFHISVIERINMVTFTPMLESYDWLGIKQEDGIGRWLRLI